MGVALHILLLLLLFVFLSNLGELNISYKIMQIKGQYCWLFDCSHRTWKITHTEYFCWWHACFSPCLSSVMLSLSCSAPRTSGCRQDAGSSAWAQQKRWEICSGSFWPLPSSSVQVLPASAEGREQRGDWPSTKPVYIYIYIPAFDLLQLWITLYYIGNAMPQHYRWKYLRATILLYSIFQISK